MSFVDYVWGIDFNSVHENYCDLAHKCQSLVCYNNCSRRGITSFQIEMEE